MAKGQRITVYGIEEISPYLPYQEAKLAVAVGTLTDRSFTFDAEAPAFGFRKRLTVMEAEALPRSAEVAWAKYLNQKTRLVAELTEDLERARKALEHAQVMTSGQGVR